MSYDPIPTLQEVPTYHLLGQSLLPSTIAVYLLEVFKHGALSTAIFQCFHPRAAIVHFSAGNHFHSRQEHARVPGTL